MYIHEKKKAQKSEQKQLSKLQELISEREECSEKILSAKFEKSSSKLKREIQELQYRIVDIDKQIQLIQA